MDGIFLRTAPWRRILSVALGFAGCLWALWFLLMCCRYDASDKFPLALKGVAAAVGVAAALGYLLFRKRLPQLVAQRRCTWLAIGAESAGFAGLGLGLQFSFESVLVLSYGLCTIGLIWALLLWLWRLASWIPKSVWLHCL